MWEGMAGNNLLLSVALLANVHSCEVAAAVSQHLAAVFLIVVSSFKSSAQSLSYLWLAAESFWCSVSFDCEPCGLKGGIQDKLTQVVACEARSRSRGGWAWQVN